MAQAKSLYISLRDDPDLNIPEGENRESAAWNEMSQRVRQHKSNAKALSLGNEVAEPSSVEKFVDFIEKAKRIEAIPIGPFKSKSEFLGYLRDFSGGTDAPGFGAIEKWFNDLPKSKKTQLAVNMNEYQDDLGDYSGSLRGEERDNFLKHLANNKHPFTVDATVDAKELRDKGYIGKGQKPAGGKYRLTPEGASHLIGDSRLRPRKGSKDPFNISANRFNQHSVDLTDEDAEWQAAERVEREDTPEQKQNRLVRDLVDVGIAEDQKAAQKIVRETTDDDTDFDAHYDKISDYHEELGGHPLKSSGSKGHIDNLNNEPFTTNKVRQHVPPTAKAPPTEEAPKEAPEEEKFEANIHGVNLESSDVEVQPNGKYKLTEEARKDLFGYTETVGESEINRDPANNPKQQEYLEGLEFGSGANISGHIGKKVPWTTPDQPKAKAAAKTKAKPAGRKRAAAPTAAAKPKAKATPTTEATPTAEEQPAEEADKQAPVSTDEKEDVPAEDVEEAPSTPETAAQTRERLKERRERPRRTEPVHKPKQPSESLLAYRERVQAEEAAAAEEKPPVSTDEKEDAPYQPPPTQAQRRQELEERRKQPRRTEPDTPAPKDETPTPKPTPVVDDTAAEAEAKAAKDAEAKAAKDAEAKAAKDADTTDDTLEDGEPSFKDRLVAHAKELHESMLKDYSPEDPDSLSDQQLDAKRHFQDIGRHIISGDDDALLAAMTDHFDKHPKVAREFAGKHPDFKKFSGAIQRGEYDGPSKPIPKDETPETRSTPEPDTSVREEHNVTDPVSRSGRLITTVELKDGTVQPFYRRTGTGGADRAAVAGQWVPFDGVHKGGNGQAPGWMDKHAYTRDESGEALEDDDPLKGYGTEEHKEIGEKLDTAFDEGNLFENQDDIIEHTTKTNASGQKSPYSTVRDNDLSGRVDDEGDWEPLHNAQELNQHLADQGSPHAQRKIDRWDGDDHRFGLAEDYVPPKPVEDVGVGDEGVDAADARADQAAAVDTGFESLFEQHKDKFQNMYDAAGHDEDMFSFEDFKETEAAEYKKKGSAKYKQGFSAAHQTHQNKQAAAAKTEKAAEVRDRKAEAKENSGEIQQRLAEQGHKVSATQAAQLYEQHDGDIDKAVESHSDEQAAIKAKKGKAEGDYPDDLSSAGIKQALFGDENPTGFLSDKLPERNDNRHGVKATALYRDLVLHHEEHGWPTTTAGKKKLTETLALLRRPDAAIKGFKRRPNEQFADYDHAEKQLADLKEQGIDPRSPEGKKILSSQDRTLHESRQNYEDKHLKPSSQEHVDENKRVWDHGNPHHVAKFDEDGNQIGRQKYDHDSGEHVDHPGNDIHHSPIKEMHQTLSEGQQTSLDKLRRAHKVKDQISKTPLNDDQRKLIGEFNEAHDSHEELKDNAVKPSPGDHHEDHEQLDSAYAQYHEKLQASSEKLNDLHGKLKDSGVHGGGDTARGIAAIGEGGDVDKHIAEHTSNLEESGLKQSDFMHDEKDIPSTGPPDSEVAKHMSGEGYQWHEDTRRWRHQETHDSAVRANGTQNGTLISGTHAPKGKYGYMASASVGSDGKINAVADSSNYAITHNGTHKVESNLGGSPPTHPQGIQSHQLGTALSGAGVDHGGTSTTFPMSHLNNTGMASSSNYSPPAGKGAALRGAATSLGRAAGGVAGGIAQETGIADTKIATTIGRAAKIGGGLINQALGKEYEDMTAVELLQVHVALQKQVALQRMEKELIAV